MHMQTIIIGAISLFVMYRVFLRVRRTIGWQQLDSGKMRLFAAIFLIVGLVFLAEGAAHTVSLVSDILGIVLGAALAYFGAALTRYEQRGGRWHYRTNGWVGMTVTVIFIGRLAYRFYDMFTMAQPAAGMQGKHGAASVWQSTTQSWSSGLMLIMFAYYAVYYWTLLRKLKKL